MATQLQAIFEGELPQQSAVYVMVDKSKEWIHILPDNVNSKYSIACYYEYTYDASKEAETYI